MNAYIVEQSSLANNIDIVLKQANGTPVWAVLKGNGYGLGLLPMAKICREKGISRFAVSDPQEAILLRESGSAEEQILMLRPFTHQSEVEKLWDKHVIYTIGGAESGALLCEFARRQNKRALAHIKIDTGMGRFGFLPSEMVEIESMYRAKDTLKITGIYTHFHSALSKADTMEQFLLFEEICNRLQTAGYQVGERHCANTTTLFRYPFMHLDSVRIGSGLLGRVAFPGEYGMQKVGYVEAAIESISQLSKGSNVGYGGVCHLKRDTKMAIIGVGFYHGFGTRRIRNTWRWQDCIRQEAEILRGMVHPRMLSVTINGKTAYVLGHVGMLHTFVDVTDIDCSLQDKAHMEINPLMLKGLKIRYL